MTLPSSPPALHFEGVSKTYPGQPAPALSDLTLTVARGSRTGIIGRSGAGKSTLVRLISGLETPDAGRLLVQGQDVTRLGRAEQRQRQARTGLVFQHFNLLAQRTVLGNVTLRSNSPGSPARSGNNARWNCSNRWVWPISPAATPRNCPAGKSSASALRARW